jgi:4-amino-4-deoxy-L-arabinose transferase-like glycosyltransferase
MVAALVAGYPGLPLGRQPFPDAQEYATSAEQLAQGHGYVTPVRDSPSRSARAENPPRYPPGYPLALSPFALFGRFPGDVELGARCVVVAMFLAVAWAALELGSSWAAIAAVVLVATGSFATVSSQIVMSDALSVALALVVMALVCRRSRAAAYAAGLAAGLGVLVRDSGAVVLVALLVVLPGRDRLRALLASAPPVAGLLCYQWAAFGRPWRTGYGFWLPGLRLFSASYVTRHPLQHDPSIPDRLHGALASWACALVSCHGVHAQVSKASVALPNWLFYPLMLAGLFWVFAPPLVPLAGAVVACRFWRLPAARLALLAGALTIAFYLAYFYQAARFVAAPAVMLTVVAAAGASRRLERTRRWRAATAAIEYAVLGRAPLTPADRS